MSKPALLIVTGSFALPELYDELVKAVEAKGIETSVPHLPSVGLKTGPREGRLPSMSDDAALISGEIERLADEGKDVIVMCHSYGGIPATESVKGLTKEERSTQGKKGGVVRLAYMTAMAPAVGVSATGLMPAMPENRKQAMKVDENGWIHYENAVAAAPLVFSELPKEEGEGWMKKFTTQSSLSFVGELTYAGYNQVPVSYLVCEGDQVLVAARQREFIDLIESESGSRVDVTSTQAGHCPPITATQEVVDWILHMAAK